MFNIVINFDSIASYDIVVIETTNRRAGVNLIRHICLHNAHKLELYTRVSCGWKKI